MNLTKKFRKSIWLALLCPGLGLSSVLDINAQQKSQIQNQIQVDEKMSIVMNRNNTYTATNGSDSKELPQRSEIKLRYQSFDPTTESPRALSPTIRNSVVRTANPEEKQAYIVQFATQAFESYQIKLKELGCDVYNHIPYHALLVHMDATTKTEVEQLPYVRWVGDYYPDYKLDNDIMEEFSSRTSPSSVMEQRYSVLLCQKNGSKEISDVVKRMGGQINVVTQGKRMEITVTPAQIVEIAAMKEVLFIDKYAAPELDMDIVREISGANYVETIEGYTGHGVRFEVLDGGFYDQHENFSHKEVLWHTSKKAVYHGTCVNSIVWGNGNKKAKARGIIPDCEQPISGYYKGFDDRYKHTGELVDPNGKYRASFQTNSWGKGDTENYSTLSAEMDELIFDHDILIFQSQGNTASRYSRPEAWAKNVVSVGGIQHYNTIDRSEHKWDYNACIGPSSDGRMKPDLAHFYDYTYAASEGTKLYQEFGGTSAATPITAGYGGLVMQMWADGVFDGGPGKNRDVFDTRPHMTTARALLINSAFQYSFYGLAHDKSRFHQGWGMVDVRKLYDEAKLNGWSLPLLINESKVLKPLEKHQYKIECDGKSLLKVTMVYADPEANPSASVHRINDLNLKVISPSGKVYWGNYGLREGSWSKSGGYADERNVVENVFVNNPEKGTWIVEVHGDEIVVDSHKETAKIDADYALVATGTKSDGANQAPPTAPVNLQIKVNSCSRISLKWNDVSDNEIYYQVIRRVQGTNKVTTFDLGVNAQSFSDNEVSEKTVYEYKVQASNLAGKAATNWKTAAETPHCGTDPIAITEIVTRCNSDGDGINEIYFKVNTTYTKVTTLYEELLTNLGGNYFKIGESGIGLGNKLDYEIIVKNKGVKVATKTLKVTATSSCNSVSEYTITASAGANGSISPSGAVNVKEGENLTFNITANSGYIIDDVLVDGKSIGPKSKYTFSNVSGNHTIEALFKKGATGDAITITDIVTRCNNAGKAVNEIYFTVNIPYTKVKSVYGTLTDLGGDSFKIVESNLGFNIKRNYKIKVKNGVKKVASKTLQVTTVSSCNSVKEYTITASAGANGSISPSGAVKVKEGESFTFNITANTGYSVDDVLVDGKSIGPKAKYTFMNVSGNHTIEALFKKDATGNAVTITDVVTDCNKKQKARNIIYTTVSVPHTSVTVNRGYVINKGNGNYKIRDIGMAKGSTYNYKITAKNGSKVVGTAYKSVKAATACRKSAVDIENAIANIQVYPVPAKELFTILLFGFENADVSIYSADGRLVYNQKEVNEQLEVNASGWNENIYIIKVMDSENVKTHKLIME